MGRPTLEMSFVFIVADDREPARPIQVHDSSPPVESSHDLETPLKEAIVIGRETETSTGFQDAMDLLHRAFL